jgi:hypothetical protein
MGHVVNMVALSRIAIVVCLDNRVWSVIGSGRVIKGIADQGMSEGPTKSMANEGIRESSQRTIPLYH